MIEINTHTLTVAMQNKQQKRCSIKTLKRRLDVFKPQNNYINTFSTNLKREKINKQKQ